MATLPPQPRPRPTRSQGFTLIELLVAIAMMAVISVMSWRALDGMSRTETLTRERADDLLALQAGLGQWAADLDALQDNGEVPALDFDGRTVRLTRRDPLESATDGSPGLQVVAWALQQGQWTRWQVSGLQTRDALIQAWAQAARWGQRPIPEDTVRQVVVAQADGWQVFYHRGDAWTHPLSSEGAAASALSAAAGSVTGVSAGLLGAAGVATARNLVSLPDGVRLVLTLSPGQTVSGDLVRDWARPVLGGGKS